MTEEEKKATENLNKLVQQRKDKTNTITIKYDSCICSTKELDIALNLIQRQETENIKLKQENEKKDKIIEYFGEELAKSDRFNNCKEDIIRFAEYEVEHLESEDKANVK